MALTSEQLRMAKEAKTAARLDVVTAAVARYVDSYETAQHPHAANTNAMAHAIKAALMATAAAFRQEAIDLESVNMRGAKGIRDELRGAAKLIEGFASGVDEATTTADAADPNHKHVEDATMAYLRGDINELPDPDSELTKKIAEQIIAEPRPALPAELIIAGGALDGITVEFNTDPIVPAPPVPGATLELLRFPTPDGLLPLLDADPLPDPLKWSDITWLAAAQAGRPQVSPSTIKELAECGFRWLISHSHVTDAANRSVERPAWWNVGGTALHAVIEQIERGALAGNVIDDPEHPSLAPMWSQAFKASKVSTAGEHPGWPQVSWRAAKRGLENEPWWLVQGLDMVRRYVRYHTKERRAPWQVLGLEMAVEKTFGVTRMAGVIDKLTQHRDSGSVRIVDYKSGGEVTGDTFQLGSYAAMIANPDAAIEGAYWDARKGAHDHEVANLLAKHPVGEIMHRATAALHTINSGSFMPRPSTMPGGCTSCPFNQICPSSAVR